MDLSQLSEGQLIEIFLKLRNKRDADKRAFTEANKPTLSAMDEVNKELLLRLNNMNLENVSCDAGTAYKSERSRASIKDREAFLDFVRQNEAWGFVDLKANVPAVVDFAENNQELPPGVSLSRDIVVNVRVK